MKKPDFRTPAHKICVCACIRSEISCIFMKNKDNETAVRSILHQAICRSSTTHALYYFL
jgi:hypothetical protein